MEDMSSIEKSVLPYNLLWDPDTDLAAAYSNTHRLIAAVASAKLIAFAKAHEAHRALWDESLHDPAGEWYPMPEWAMPSIRGRCFLLWIKHGIETDEYFRSIPKK